MTLKLRGSRSILLAAAALVTVGIRGGGGFAQEARPELRIQELETALALSRKKLEEVEKKNTGLEAKNRALTESLAESNRILEQLRTDHEELLLRVASFGVDLMKPDPKSLQQRFLNSVRERQVVEEKKEKMARQLLRLSEAAVHFLQTAVSPDAGSRAMIEQELRAANEVLGPATTPQHEKVRALGEGRVVSVDPEIGLVVLNVGRKSGVRVGMPLRILRAETEIGTAMVVDVRDSISGAVLQRIVADDQDVKVGDRIEPEARQF